MQIPHIIKFKEVVDSTGTLVVAHKELPFQMERVFWIHGVEEGGLRGNHANINSSKVVICLNGEVDIELEGLDGSKTRFQLRNNNEGLLIPNLFWNKIKFHNNALLMCIASGVFNEKDYIRDYSDFRNYKKE
jgi:hypothetical protein